MTPANFLELFFERLIRFYESFADIMLLPIDIIIKILNKNRNE